MSSRSVGHQAPNREHPELTGAAPAVGIAPVGTTTAGEPLTLPSFYMPFRARMNQHTAQARIQSRKWAQEHGLISAGGWDFRRFDGIDLAGLCGQTHPDADAARLTLVACWYIWLYFVDDFYTESVMSASGVAGSALTDLWSETQPLMGDDWCGRFTESNLRGLEEHAHEQANTLSGRVPSPLEYAAMRRRGNNGKWAAELVESAIGAALPPVMAHSLVIRELLDCFGDIVRLHNDIVSYNRETQQENEVNNGVLVLATARGCSPQQAAETVNDTLTMRVRHFEHLITVDLPVAVDLHRLDEVERETVTRYAGALGDHLAGYYAWQHTSTRDAHAVDAPTHTSSGPSPTALGGPTGLGTSAARITVPHRHRAEATTSPAPQENSQASAVAAILASSTGEVARFPLRERTLRLAARVAECFDDRGAVSERSASRVLESTMMLALLRRARRHPESQAGLVRFLSTRLADPDLTAVERTVAEASLGLRGRPSGEDDPFGHYAHHSTSRKQLMFGTYLAVLGAGPYPDLGASFDYRGQTTWVELGMCAVKILNAAGRGRSDTITTQDRAFLIESLEASRREVWEGNAAAHLLALLAVHTTDPDHPLVGDGIDAILRVRAADGGIPFVTDCTLYLSSVAGLALARCHSDYHRGLLTRIGDYLADHQNPDHGWAFTERVRQNDVDSAGSVLELLHALDPDRYAHAITRGREYIAGTANADGGFPTYLRGQPSEAVMTANAVIALAPAWHQYADVLDNAVPHLLRAQKPDGTFESSWSLSEAHAIRRVVTALTHLPDHARTRRQHDIGHALHLAGSYLERTQNPDGGFGHRPGDDSDPISTAHSARAGAILGHLPWHRHALAYLLRHQHPDGGFVSKTDQVGPRPIPYDFPNLANITVLTALATTSG